MLAGDAFVLESAPPINILTIRPVKKTPRRSWSKWAKVNNLKNTSVFRVRYKGTITPVRGEWQDQKYYLLSDRVAPIPVGREADAEKNGWGSPIKWDCPTHVVALIKMSHGAKLNKRGRAPDSSPYELELLRENGQYLGIYK